jgi:hypothetical protein
VWLLVKVVIVGVVLDGVALAARSAGTGNLVAALTTLCVELREDPVSSPSREACHSAAATMARRSSYSRMAWATRAAILTSSSG